MLQLFSIGNGDRVENAMRVYYLKSKQNMSIREM